MSRSTEPRRAPQHTFRRPLASILVVLVALLGLLVAVPAEAATGDITGRLVDQYGNEVLGLDFTIYDSALTPYPVTSDPATGDFLVNVPADGEYSYEIEGEFDDLGYGYVSQSDLFDVVGTYDFGDLVLERFENVAGTIDNWDPAMTEVYLTVYFLDPLSGSWDVVGYDASTTDGTFSVPAILDDGYYTMQFTMYPFSTAPYLDAYLGGEFDEPDESAYFFATAGSPQTISMTLPPAAMITGRVTADGGATALSGILVVALQESGAATHGDFASTDGSGEYAVRARPGETYSVSVFDPSGGPDPYAAMTYNGFYGCSCQFTPVIPTALDPAADVDFEMTRESELFVILGELSATSFDTGPDLEDIRIHVQRLVAGTWTELAVAESDSFGEFEVVVPRDDIAYRLIFEDSGTVLRVVDGEVGPGSAPAGDPVPAGCFVDTGVADPSWLDSGVLYYVDLGLNPGGGCSTTPVPPGSPGTQIGSGRGRTAATSSPVVPNAAPTPTPTPTVTPRPTTSPTPAAADPADPAPASAPDLWWLLWVGIGLLVIVVMGGVVFFFRRM